MSVTSAPVSVEQVGKVVEEGLEKEAAMLSVKSPPV